MASSTQSVNQILKSLNQMFTLQWHLAQSSNDQVQAKDTAGNQTIVNRDQFNRTLEGIYNQIRRLEVSPRMVSPVSPRRISPVRSPVSPRGISPVSPRRISPVRSPVSPRRISPVSPAQKFGYALVSEGCQYIQAIDNDPAKLLKFLNVIIYLVGSNIRYRYDIIRVTPGNLICGGNILFSAETTDSLSQFETRGFMVLNSLYPKGNLTPVIYISYDATEESPIFFEHLSAAKANHQKLIDIGFAADMSSIIRYQLGTTDPNEDSILSIYYPIDIAQYRGSTL